MKKLFLILSMISCLTTNMFASEYLSFILQAIKKNTQLPIKLDYGEITKIKIKGNKVLVMYIKTTKKVSFQKKKICKMPLFEDIIKEDGVIEYHLNGVTKGTYIFNKNTCENNN